MTYTLIVSINGEASQMDSYEGETPSLAFAALLASMPHLSPDDDSIAIIACLEGEVNDCRMHIEPPVEYRNGSVDLEA